MHEASIYETAFVINNAHYEYLGMSFGLSNAPKTFQRSKHKLLNHLPYIKVFLDDMLMHSKNIKDYYKHINEVFKILQENEVRINFEKSNFLQSEITYLGHKINGEGIKADKLQLENLNNINIRPKNLKELQSTLGVINRFRPYVIDLSSKIARITDKLSEKKYRNGKKVIH